MTLLWSLESKCYPKHCYTLYLQGYNFNNFIIFQRCSTTFIHNTTWTGIQAFYVNLKFLAIIVILFFFCPQIVISDTEDLDPLETNPVTTPYRLVKDDSTPSQYLKFLFGHLGPKKWLNGWLN